MLKEAAEQKEGAETTAVGRARNGGFPLLEFQSLGSQLLSAEGSVSRGSLYIKS